MTDIEHWITGFLHDEADKAVLPNRMYQRVLGQARMRRLMTATVTGIAMIAVIMAGVVAVGAIRSLSSIAPAGPEPLPVPTVSRDESRRESENPPKLVKAGESAALMVAGTRDCPALLRPGPRARRGAQAAGRRWARAQEGRLPSGTRFGIKVAPATGAPRGGCYPHRIGNREQTWRRTWVGIVSWRYPKGSGVGSSASLASSTIFLGRTARGWGVYFQNH